MARKLREGLLKKLVLKSQSKWKVPRKGVKRKREQAEDQVNSTELPAPAPGSLVPFRSFLHCALQYTFTERSILAVRKLQFSLEWIIANKWPIYLSLLTPFVRVVLLLIIYEDLTIASKRIAKNLIQNYQLEMFARLTKSSQATVATVGRNKATNKLFLSALNHLALLLLFCARMWHLDSAPVMEIGKTPCFCSSWRHILIKFVIDGTKDASTSLLEVFPDGICHCIFECLARKHRHACANCNEPEIEGQEKFRYCLGCTKDNPIAQLCYCSLKCHSDHWYKEHDEFHALFNV